MSNTLKVHVDTPETYQPQMIVGQRFLANVEALSDTQVSSPKFNPDLLRTEEVRLGISLNDDPEEFVNVHNTFIREFQERLQSKLQPGIEKTVEAVATYLAKGDERKYQNWKNIFHLRVASYKQILVTDHLNSGRMADNSPLSTSITVNSFWGLIDAEESDAVLDKIILPHEIIHSLTTHARTKGGIKTDFFVMDLPSRNGLSTTHLSDAKPEEKNTGATTHGEWLNEAYIEDLRSQIFSTDEVGYPRPVAVLRMLKDLDKGLELALDSSAFGPEGPGNVIGRIEGILGPLGVEAIDDLISNNWDSDKNEIVPLYQDPDFINKVVGLVDKDLKVRAEASLKLHLSSVKPVPIPNNLRSGH